MSSDGVIFQLNKREWFYIVDHKEIVHKQLNVQTPQDVYGPFPNSLIANTHMSSCHRTKNCRLVYQDDIKHFFAEQWDGLQQKITYSRAHPQHSHSKGEAYGF